MFLTSGLAGINGTEVASIYTARFKHSIIVVSRFTEATGNELSLAGIKIVESI